MITTANYSDRKKIVEEQQFNASRSDLDSLLEKCDNLSPDKKARLLKHLLSDQCISVVFGNSNLYADTIYQINLSDKDQVAHLLRAVASRISKEAEEKPQSEPSE